MLTNTSKDYILFNYFFLQICFIYRQAHKKAPYNITSAFLHEYIKYKYTYKYTYSFISSVVIANGILYFFAYLFLKLALM